MVCNLVREFAFLFLGEIEGSALELVHLEDPRSSFRKYVLGNRESDSSRLWDFVWGLYT